MVAQGACPHFAPTDTTPRTQSCESCGSRHALRMCTECGHVGCCESQYGHNTAHYRETGHPIIRSLPLDSRRSFTWCYECHRYL